MKKNYLININKKLCFLYGNKKGNKLFDFYCNIMTNRNNLIEIKNTMTKTKYYKNLKDLKKAQINCFENIDFNQYINEYIINFSNLENFKWKEIY